MSNQGRLDFSRAEQRYLLRVVRLPIWAPPAGPDGKARGRVSESAQKTVLISLDSFGRECWAAEVTLAAAAGICRRSCQKALEALVARSLITKTRQWCAAAGQVRNHYRVVWSELEQLARAQGALAGGGALVGAVDQSASRVDQSASRVDQSALGAPKALSKPQEAPTTRAGVVLGLVEGVEAIVEKLERVGVGALVARRIAQKVPADNIDVAITEFEANRGLFRGAGALVARLVEGAWPVELKTADQVAAARASAERARRERLRGRLYGDLCAQWKSAGRWSTATDSEIEAELGRRLAIVEQGVERERLALGRGSDWFW